MSRSKEEGEDNRARFGFWNAVRPKRRPAPKLEARPVALPRGAKRQGDKAGGSANRKTTRTVVPAENPEGKEYLPNSGDAISKSSASPFPGASVFWFSLFTKRTVTSNLNYTNKRTIEKQKIRPSKGEGRIFVYRNVCYLQFSTRTKKRRSAPRVHSSNNKRANKNPPLPYVRNSVSSLVSRVPDPSETTLQI